MNKKIFKGKRFWAWTLSAAMVLTAAPINMGVTKDAKAAELKSADTKYVYSMPLFNDGTNAYAIKYPSELYLGSDVDASMVKVPMAEAKKAYENAWKPYAQANKTYEEEYAQYLEGYNQWHSKPGNEGKTEADYLKENKDVKKPLYSDLPAEPTVIENYANATEIKLSDIGITPDDKDTEDVDEKSKGHVQWSSTNVWDELSLDFVDDNVLLGNPSHAGTQSRSVNVILPKIAEKQCMLGDYVADDEDVKKYGKTFNGLGDSYVLTDDADVPEGKSQRDNSIEAKVSIKWLSLLEVTDAKAAVNGGEYQDLNKTKVEGEAAEEEKDTDYDFSATKGDRIAIRTNYKEVSEDNFENLKKDDQEDLKGGRHYEIEVDEQWNGDVTSGKKDEKGNAPGVFRLDDQAQEIEDNVEKSCTYIVRRKVYKASGQVDNNYGSVVLERKTVTFHLDDTTDYTYTYLGNDKEYAYYMKYAKDNFVGDDFSYRLYQVRYAVPKQDDSGNDVYDEKGNQVYVAFKNGGEDINPSEINVKAVKADYLKWIEPNTNQTIEAVNEDATDAYYYNLSDIIELTSWSAVLGTTPDSLNFNFKYDMDNATGKYTWQLYNDATDKYDNTNLTTLKDKLSGTYPEFSFKDLPSYGAEIEDELAKDGRQMPGTIYETNLSNRFIYTVGSGFFTNVLKDSRVYDDEEDEVRYEYTNDTTSGEDAAKWPLKYQYQTGNQSYLLTLPLFKKQGKSVSKVSPEILENGIELNLNWKEFPTTRNDVKNDNYHFTKNTGMMEIEIPTAPDAIMKETEADDVSYGYSTECFCLQYMNKDGKWIDLDHNANDSNTYGNTLDTTKLREGRLEVNTRSLTDNTNGIYAGRRNVRYASVVVKNTDDGFSWSTSSGTSSSHPVLVRDDKTFQTYTLVGVEEYPVSVWDPSDDSFKQNVSLAKKMSEGDKIVLAPELHFADGYAGDAIYQWQRKSTATDSYEDIQGAAGKQYTVMDWKAPKNRTYDAYRLVIKVKVSEDEVYTAIAEYILSKDTVDAIFTTDEQTEENDKWKTEVAAGDQIDFTYQYTKADYATADNYDIKTAWTRHSIEAITDIEFDALMKAAKEKDESATKEAQEAADKAEQEKTNNPAATASPVETVTAEQDKLTEGAITEDGKTIHPYQAVFVDKDGDITNRGNALYEPVNAEYARKYYYHEVEEELSTTEALNYTVKHQDFVQKLTKGYEYVKSVDEDGDFKMTVKEDADKNKVEQTYEKPQLVNVADLFFGNISNPDESAYYRYEGTYFTIDVKATLKDDVKNVPYEDEELFKRYSIVEETNVKNQYSKDESPYTIVKDQNVKYFTEGDEITITAPKYTINEKNGADKNAYKVAYQWQRLVELKDDEEKGTAEKQFTDADKDGQKRVFTDDSGKTVTKYYLYEDWEGKTDQTLTISNAEATEKDKEGYTKYYDKYRCIISPLRGAGGNRQTQLANDNAPASLDGELADAAKTYYYRVKVLPKDGAFEEAGSIEAESIEAYRVSDYKQFVPLGGNATMEAEAELILGENYLNDKENAVKYKENSNKTIFNFQWRHNGEILSGATVKKSDEANRASSSFTVNDLKLDGKGSSYGSYICRIWVEREDGLPNEDLQEYVDVEFILAEKTDISITNFKQDNADSSLYEAYLYGKNLEDSFDFTVDATNTSGNSGKLTYTWAKKNQNAKDCEWSNLIGKGYSLLEKDAESNTRKITIENEDDYTDYECIVSNGRSTVKAILHVVRSQSRCHAEIKNTKNINGTDDEAEYLVPENGSKVLAVDTEIEDTKHVGVEYIWSKRVYYGATTNGTWVDDELDDNNVGGFSAYRVMKEETGSILTVSKVQERNVYQCQVNFYRLDDEDKTPINGSATFTFTVDVEPEVVEELSEPEFDEVREYGYNESLDIETKNRIGDKVRFGVEQSNTEDYDGEITYIWRFIPADRNTVDYEKTDGKYRAKRLVNQKDGLISIASLAKEDFGTYMLEIQYETTEKVTDPATGKEKQKQVIKPLYNTGTTTKKIYTYHLNRYNASGFSAKAKNGTGQCYCKPGDDVTFKTEVELDEDYTDGKLYYNWVDVYGNALYGENTQDKTLKNIKKWDFGNYFVEVTLVEADGSKTSQTVKFSLNPTDNLTVESNLLTDNNIDHLQYTNLPYTWNYTRYFGDQISFAVKAQTDTPAAHPITYTWQRISKVNGTTKVKNLKETGATFDVGEILKKDFKTGGTYTYTCLVSNGYDDDVTCTFNLFIRKPNADDQFLYFDEKVVDVVADAEEINETAWGSIWESYQGEAKDIEVTTAMYDSGLNKEQNFKANVGNQITMSADAIADAEDAALITYTWKHWDPVQQRYVTLDGAKNSPHLTTDVTKDDLKGSSTDFVQNANQYLCEVSLDDEESKVVIRYYASINKINEFTVDAEKKYVLEGSENTMKATLTVEDKEDFTYQWYAEDEDGNVVRIEGATDTTYQIPSKDIKLKHVNKNDTHKKQSDPGYGYTKGLVYFCTADKKIANPNEEEKVQYVGSDSFDVVYNPDDTTELPKSCNEVETSIYKVKKEGAQSLTLKFSDEYVLGTRYSIFKIYTAKGDCIQYNTWKDGYKDVAGETLEIPGDTAVIYYDPYYYSTPVKYDENLLKFTTSAKRGYEVVYADDTEAYKADLKAKNDAENAKIKAENDKAVQEAQEEAEDKQKINNTALSAGSAVDAAADKAENAQLSANMALAHSGAKASTVASKGGIASVTDTGSVWVAKKKIVLEAGKSVTVKCAAADASGKQQTPKASTTNTKVAAVKTTSDTQLKVSAPAKAEKGASTTMIVSCNTAFVKITVVIKNPVKKLAPAKKKLTVKNGKSVTVKFNVTAANNKKAATDSLKAKLSKKIGKLSKKKVAKGAVTMTFKATKKGKAKLTVSLGGKSATTNIVVK